MKCLITGVAGFLGSHLAERLLHEGYDLCGVDGFIDNYSRTIKENNLSSLKSHPRFQFVEGDLVTLELERLISGTDYVFHLAAQPGVRSSWGQEFRHYTHNNVLATQKLLEASKSSDLKKLVHASSSSIYGDASDLPMRENTLPQPISPYGVSKLAAEHLCHLYWKNFSLPTVSLRFFTVYGPRQRPDMFFNILMRSLLHGESIPLFDDGNQSRDFTFFGDILEGTLAAAFYPGSGEAFNLGGGSRITLPEAIGILEEIAGKKAQLKKRVRQQGDVRHTEADITLARKKLDFNPRVSLTDGLTLQWEWMRKQVESDPA